jgi:oligopeptide transport system substrate-binding protein
VLRVGVVLFSVLFLVSCGKPWNNPYPRSQQGQNILYSSFEERPNHLDPGRSYASNEYTFIAQIYEPLLQYDYLQRPYKLTPLTATKLPEVKFYDSKGELLTAAADPNAVDTSVYTLDIQPNIFYQPHPALAKAADGRFAYHSLSLDELADKNTLSDFPLTGSRVLKASDYVYQIKRLADPRVHCPILGVMRGYIVGLDEYANTLSQQHKLGEDVNLLDAPISGVKVLSDTRYQITIKGKYPQFLYWLSMPFFAPMPPEADAFYQQDGMKEKNLTLDWYPIGSGPYMLTENNPNRQMVLSRNPNFHGERYPQHGTAEDEANGLLKDAGKTMPFVDQVVFSLEKENIPYWSKFLQGYYDISGISSDSFDQAIQFSPQGDPKLTSKLDEKGIRLVTTVRSSIMYTGFNMLDPVVGGLTDQGKKLRQAISIAMDYEEYIAIFANGRGLPAQGPIPPGIFGYLPGQEGINPQVYTWQNGKAQRRPIAEAKRLLAEAGYPNGIDSATGKPLVLYLDATSGGVEDGARMNWLRKQFAKLNIQLTIRATSYNRFQEKVREGLVQIFQWGWNADYPDPENLLFLLYGPNSKVGFNGENAANYDNPQFNALFDQMKNRENDAERQRLMNKILRLIREDAPWVWGFHPQSFALYHQWHKNSKPHMMANNTLKYVSVDVAQRQRLRAEWNPPILWPLWLLGGFVVLLLWPAWRIWRRHERQLLKGQ